MAADDVLLLFGVRVQGRRLPVAGIHELFAILGLFREVDEHEPVFGKIAEPEVGDVPAGVWRLRPAMTLEARGGFDIDIVNLASLHKEVHL